MRPLSGSLVHACDRSVHGRAAGHRALTRQSWPPRGSNLPVGLLADVDASVARPRLSATVASSGWVQNARNVFLDFYLKERKCLSVSALVIIICPK